MDTTMKKLRRPASRIDQVTYDDVPTILGAPLSEIEG